MNTPDTWIQELLECNRRDFSPAEVSSPEQGGPTLSSRSFAIATRAMAHAYFLNGPLSTPFAYTGLNQVVPPPAGADKDSALHGAAVAVLTGLFSRQRVQIERVAAANPPTHQASADWGRSIAEEHLADRLTDGSSNPAPYVYSNTPGAHQEDPEHTSTTPTPSAPHGVGYGRTKPFGVLGMMLRLDKPPGYLGQGRIDRANTEYLRDFNGVKKLGHESNTANTNDAASLDRALIGIYWAYDGVNRLGTPPRLYFQVIRKILLECKANAQRQMMAYAVCGTALGDAGIHAWHYKYEYNIWRPVTGIRHHDESFGAEGLSTTKPQPSNSPVAGDPFWRPLGAPRTNGTGKNFTPGFPAYPSGHATFGAASLHALRLMLAKWFPQKVKVGQRKDNIAFTFVSDEWNGKNRDVRDNVRARHERHFKSIEDAIVENGLSRVYLGVHWTFDAEMKKGNEVIGGVPLGINIADHILNLQAYDRAVRNA